MCREWELFFFAEGAAKVQNWLNFLHPEGFVTEYHNVGVCVLIWLRESEKNTAKEIENVTNITGVRQIELWRRDDLQHPRLDEVAEEVPVALVYNGISHVVMMASPKDLEYFAIGFRFPRG